MPDLPDETDAALAAGAVPESAVPRDAPVEAETAAAEIVAESADASPADDADAASAAPEPVAPELVAPVPVVITDADPALVDVARSALLEIAPAGAVGDPIGQFDEGDGVASVLFATLLPGYPGWRWTVSVAHLDGLEPSVLEAELLPGDGALLAPDWVPWSERLADWKAAQEAAALAAAAEGDDESDADESDDDDEVDADVDADDDGFDDDVDDESPRRTHGGDLDGVDIDEVIDDE